MTSLVANGGADSLDGGAGVDTLAGGLGDNVFSFTKVKRTATSSPTSSATARTLTQDDATHWSINSSNGVIHDIITLTNGAVIHVSDYLFAWSRFRALELRDMRAASEV